MPTMAIVGMDKSGTTDAYLELTLQCGGFSSGTTKEPGCLYAPTVARQEQCYRSCFANLASDALTLDGTPNYLYSVR